MDEKKNLKAKIYIDLNHLEQILFQYKQDIFTTRFIEKFLNRMVNLELDIIDIVCYGDFESSNSKNNNTQSYLNSLGISTIFQTYTSISNNSYLITDASRDLYENDVIDIFVFFSRVNAIKPILKNIKTKGKGLILSDQKNHFENDIILKKEKFYPIYDFVKLVRLEEINEMKSLKVEESLNKVDVSNLTQEEVKDIRNVYEFLKQSPLVDKFEETKNIDDLITFGGFLNLYGDYSKLPRDIVKENIFKAHKLGYLEVYYSVEREKYCVKKK